MARYENLSVNNLMSLSTDKRPITGKRGSQACSIATTPTALDTVTIGSTVYTFGAAAAVTAAAGQTDRNVVTVLIGGTAAASLTNLVAAINGNGTAGTTYNLSAKKHVDVVAEETDGTVFEVMARRIGVPGNSIATTETFTDVTDAWTAATLTGGVDGTPGKKGQIMFVGTDVYECVDDQVWRAPHNHTVINFKEFADVLSTDSTRVAASAGTDNTTNTHLVNGKDVFESHNIGTQTIINPTSVPGTGLLCSLDLTDTEGVEYSQGITSVSKHARTVGADPGFFVRAKIKVADVTGCGELAVGFRKAEAYNTIDGYDEAACFNIQLGVVNIETAINGASMVTTDTTETDWADGETHTVEVRVDDFGNVTYKYDDAAPTVVPTTNFAFDTGEVVIPFFQILHATTTPGAVHLIEWETGYLA